MFKIAAYFKNNAHYCLFENLNKKNSYFMAVFINQYSATLYYGITLILI